MDTTTIHDHSVRATLTEEDISDARSAMAATWDRMDVSGCCVVDGHGMKVSVHRGHLVVVDGLGPYRRERRYARATHGLSRVVIVGGSGSLTLDALRWLDGLGIHLLVLEDGAPIFASMASGRDDARLRREQAKAGMSPLGLALSRDLLSIKVRGQSDNLRRMNREVEADALASMAVAIEDSESIKEARDLEATAALAYFQAWVDVGVGARFARRDRERVPVHWGRFDGRRSMLNSVSGNRKAERPVNAILNYLYSLLEAESVTACRVVGLDPGLGFVHSDSLNKPSLALDIMEAVRPQVESYVLDLMERRTFRKLDFIEGPDGHVRILAPLTHELAETISRWRRAVAPIVERVAQVLGSAISGKWTATHPLTGRERRRAQIEVKARKYPTIASLQIASRAGVHQRPADEGDRAPRVTCQGCGVILPRSRMTNCPECFTALPGQDEVSRRRRGAGIAATRAELESWRRSEQESTGIPAVGPGRPIDRVASERFRSELLPRLAGVKLVDIMAAIGCAKSTASAIRSGKQTPHVRHWSALAQLGQ